MTLQRYEKKSLYLQKILKLLLQLSIKHIWKLLRNRILSHKGIG